MLKNIIFIFIAFLGMSLMSFDNTDSKPTKEIMQDTIFVDGICNMCKDRIENAALVRGVKKVEWNKATSELVVIYDSSKTSLNIIQLSINEAGYDTRDHKAKLEDYKRLPKCCAYREPGAKKH